VLPPAGPCPATRFGMEGSGDANVRDRDTGLTWQRSVDPTMRSWDEAIAYCVGLGGGWRLPSLTELQTIIDDGRIYPAIDVVTFPDTPKVVFWTSTPRADDPGTAWYVDFFYGATDADIISRAYAVRCVR